MKILFVYPGGEIIGGGSMALLRFIKRLDKRFTSEVVCLTEGSATDLFRKSEIATYVISFPTFPHSTQCHYNLLQPFVFLRNLKNLIPGVLKTSRLLKNGKYDCVFIKSSTPIFFAVQCKLKGIPVFWNINEDIYKGKLGLRRAILTRIFNFAGTRIVPVSNYVKGTLIASPKIVLIPDAVDTNEFNPEEGDGGKIRKELAISADQFVIGWIGAFVPYKGLLTLVQAAKYIADKIPNAHFLIVGPSLYLDTEKTGIKYRFKRMLRLPIDVGEEARNLIRDNRLENNFSFTGARLDIPDLIAAMDVLAYPSDKEPFGIPVLEAGSMQKPVVASHNGGPIDVIRDGYNGLFFNPNDPEDLAAKILSIYSNPEKAQKLGINARKIVQKHFSYTKHMKKSMRLIVEIVR